MSADLERMPLKSGANSVGSGGRSLSVNVRKLHNALNLLLNDYEREQFIHCLNIYHAKRNVFDLVQTLKVILNTPSKRQLLPMLRLVIPRSDQLLFDQYTSEGLYLKADLLASSGNPESLDEISNTLHARIPSVQFLNQPEQPLSCHASLRASADSFSTTADGTAPAVPNLGSRVFMQEETSEFRQVTLKRSKSNEGLGFSIRGGSEHGVGIYVSLVEPGSFAEREGLRVGDQIMTVNDMVFDRVTHGEAVKVLKGSKKLSMSVCSVGRIPGGYITNHVYTWVDPQGRSVSPPPELVEQHSGTGSQRRGHTHTPQPEEKRVNVSLEDGRSLGLMIRGGAEYALGIYITGVDRGSAAEYGGLKVGDQILDVNGRSFHSILHDEAVQILKTSERLLMRVREVGRLPHARTMVDETKWIPSPPIAESSASAGPPRLSMDVGTATPGKPALCAGVSGTLRSQPGSSLEEQAFLLLTEPERQTLSYYLEEYRDAHISLEPLTMALFELLNTHAKFSLLAEVRALLAPQDLERFDGLVLHREMEAWRARHGGMGSLHLDSVCLSHPDAHAPSGSQLTLNALSYAKNESRMDGSLQRGPLETLSALPDIALDEVPSSSESPPGFKPPPPPSHSRHPSPKHQAKRPSSRLSQSSLLFSAPCRDLIQFLMGRQAAVLCPHAESPDHSRAGTPPPSPRSSSLSPSPSLATPGPPPCSPESGQATPNVARLHRLNPEAGEAGEERRQPQPRGATLSQLSDSGQTLSEDSGVDIPEAGGLSKDGSPRPGKPPSQQPSGDTQGSQGPAAQAPTKQSGLAEPTLVRVVRSANTLGIAVEGGANTRQPLPRIVTIQKGGSAHNCGELRVGQVILEVNGVSLKGKEHRDAARLIAEAFKTKERDHIDFLVTEFNATL